MRRPPRYDLVVIGGGTAGLVSAQIAAGAGARVALVERARTGGDCLWTGCVPSKALLATADLAQRMRRARDLGLEPVEPEIDFGRVMARVRAVQARIEPDDSPERLRADGVEVRHGEARFSGPRTVVVAGRPLSFRAAIVATGSAPAIPPIPGLAEAEPLTSDTVWDLDQRPEALAVLGGGPVGCELAQGFARLGSRVAIVEAAPRLLVREEPAAGELIARRLAAEGVDVRLGAAATKVHEGRLHLASGEPVRFDRILVAAGRRPVTEGLDLAAAGVRTDPRGAVIVDGRLRTSARNVYAAGDVTGALPFTHVAAYHARIATANALFGGRGKVDYAAVPWATFTDPEVGRVGLTEAEARERFGDRVQVARSDYAHLDRAITGAQDEGFALLVGDPRGRLVGATVAAPGGGEAIAELAAWTARGGKIADVSRTVHAYPTLAEGPARAADEHLRARLLSPRVRRVTRPVLAARRWLAALG